MESGGVAFSICVCHDLLGAPWPDIGYICEGRGGAFAGETFPAVFWSDKDVEVVLVVSGDVDEVLSVQLD